MNTRFQSKAVGLLGLLLLASNAYADPPVKVQLEINFLLGYVEGSNCQFYRNGSWHDARAAQAHLRDKYKFLAARDLISTTDEFIERAATKSSLSGKSYEVKCADGITVDSNAWLHTELARLQKY